MATYFITTPAMATIDGVTASDANAGTSAAAPWLTIGKVNGFAFVAGDIVQFRRDGVWSGVALNINRSGAPGNNITFRDYAPVAGAGAKPQINGFTTAGAWVLDTGTVYRQIIGALPVCKGAVLLDGVFQAMGKYPKGNQGYYNISTATPNTNGAASYTITGNTAFNSNLNFSSVSNPAPHPTAPNVVGGELCYRPQHWVLWRGTVTAQAVGSITFTPFTATGGGVAYTPIFRGPNYGFFLQNHKSVCDTLGEWAYDPTGTYSGGAGGAHTFYMNFPSGPAGHTVKIATIDILVQLNISHDLLFSQIDFQGANTYIVNGNGAININFDNCNIQYSGEMGFFANGTATGWNITNSTISYINSIGIQASSAGANWVVSGNTIDRCGHYAGMGGSGESLQYTGIKGSNTSLSAWTIANNTVTNSGYIPICYIGRNNFVRNNYVDTYGYVKQDTGGIYTSGQFQADLTGTQVFNNIILNGIGSPVGTPDTDIRAYGLYADDFASNYEIYNNSIAFMGGWGFYLHVNTNINIHGNTFYDCKRGSVIIRNVDDTGLGHVTSNLNYHNNINFARTATQPVWELPTPFSTTWFATTTDSNKYCRSITSDGAIFFIEPSTFDTLTQWRSLLTSPRELNSSGSPVFVTSDSQLKFVYNTGLAPATTPLPGTWVDVFNTVYAGSITLQPSTSAVLMQTSTGGPPVFAYAHSYFIG